MQKQVIKKVKQKSKSVFAKIVFSRTMVTILLLLIQVFLLLSIPLWFAKYWIVVYSCSSVLGALAIIYIINDESNPGFKMAWIIPICVLPVFGTLLFLFVNWNFGYFGLKKAFARSIKETRIFLELDAPTQKRLEESDREFTNLANYLFQVENYRAYADSATKYFPSGEEAYESMLEELKKAEKFIFLEYFIVEEGVMWNSILDILVEKAQKGVEVRFMYDGMCSLVLLPYSYPDKLRKKGLHVKQYAPVKPLLSTHQNYRDHRKIMVIDGKVAFTGGINLADNYINLEQKLGYWKDVAIKIEGAAVKSFSVMFLQMWNLTETNFENIQKYVDVIAPTYQNENGIVIPYGDGPTNDEHIAESVYIDMIYRAEKYVHIMTPYFVVDNELLTALIYAAKRGIDVVLVFPNVSDSPVTFAMGRTYYPQLIKAGVKIYEFAPGFVHAKVFVSDDMCATVGSINLDYRSLYHHFECGIYLHQQACIKEIERDVQNTIEKSIQIDMNFYNNIPLFKRFAGRAFRLIGPLV